MAADFMVTQSYLTILVHNVLNSDRVLRRLIQSVYLLHTQAFPVLSIHKLPQLYNQNDTMSPADNAFFIQFWLKSYL